MITLLTHQNSHLFLAEEAIEQIGYRETHSVATLEKVCTSGVSFWSYCVWDLSFLCSWSYLVRLPLELMRNQTKIGACHVNFANPVESDVTQHGGGFPRRPRQFRVVSHIHVR